MTEKEMKRAGRKAVELMCLLERLDPKVGILQDRFFTDPALVFGGDYPHPTKADMRVRDFLVAANRDFPEILEYLQELEERVGEQQKTIDKLQAEIEDNW